MRKSDEYAGGVKIIYGPPGCGKTKLAMALMERMFERYGSKSLYLDRESSWISATREMREGGYVDRFGIMKKVEKVVKFKGKEKVKITTTDPIDDMYEFAGEASSGKYGVVVVDTFSTVAYDIMGSVVSKDISSGRSGTNRVNVSTEAGVKISHPTMQDFGVFASVVDEWARRIWPAVESGVLVVLIAHQKKLESLDEETVEASDSVGTIDVPGKMVALGLPKLADLMVRCTQVRRKRGKGEKGRRVDYVIYPEGDGIWVAKDRLGVFDPTGEVWTVGREEFDGIEEHSSAVGEVARQVWDDWLDRWDEVRGFKRGRKK